MLKKHLILCNCAAYRFKYYRVHNYSNNCLVSSYIAPISVKLGFVFTWIGLAFILQLCFIPKEKVRSIFIFYQVF